MAYTFFVTGAARGLGAEFVRQLSARGDRVIATARVANAEMAEAASAGPVRRLVLDVGTEPGIAGLGAQIGGEAIDVLVNNAGVSSEARTIATLSAAELQRVFMVNSFAPILVTRQLSPCLKRGTRKLVVNISSQLGSIANNAGPGGGGSSYAYRASKAALNMLTVSMGHELKGEGIACVAMHPGWVRTDMGGEKAPLSPEESVRSMLRTIDRLTMADTGRFINHDGAVIPY